ncbi:hypothetical protein DRB96_39410 [Streptomyces sp. ICC1]|nr:hypothetical protein DRB96_39410 [Streptomyces sp. ICC1]
MPPRTSRIPHARSPAFRSPCAASALLPSKTLRRAAKFPISEESRAEFLRSPRLRSPRLRGPHFADSAPPSPQHPCTPPELNPRTWDLASCPLRAKILGEFGYEEIIRPVPAPAPSGDPWPRPLDHRRILRLSLIHSSEPTGL